MRSFCYFERELNLTLTGNDPSSPFRKQQTCAKKAIKKITQKKAIHAFHY